MPAIPSMWKSSNRRLAMSQLTEVTPVGGDLKQYRRRYLLVNCLFVNDSASALFDSIERDHVRPLLKDLGFRKRALTFSRARDGLTDVVSLQRSTGNTAGHVRFYVNCGVYSSEFSTVLGQPVRDRPREGDCQFRCRMETLVPEAPQWFEIEAFQYRLATEDWVRARGIYQSIRAEFGSEDRWPRIDENLKRHVPPAELARVCAVVWNG